MPEASEDAMILISISYQALLRAQSNDPVTVICNSAIVILFACFFIEANLNHIIDKMKLKGKLDKFFNPKGRSKSDPGLTSKLIWFYNFYGENLLASNSDELYKSGIKKKLDSRFPGFFRIDQYRNDIAHGKIDKSISNLKDAEILRSQAKEIVNELYKIAEQAGREIPRSITYEMAIGKEMIQVQSLNNMNSISANPSS